MPQWIIPYIDQPVEFWQSIAERLPGHIREIYFPLPADVIGSGEPTQPSEHRDDVLRNGPFPCSVLLNPITLARPVEEITPGVIEAVRRLIGEYGLAGATVANLTLAMRLREAFPDLPLTASCLMLISQPNQVAMLDGVFDNLVPANRIVRDLPALRAVKEAFPGKLRLIVNEACLPGCPLRVQHFNEMGRDLPHPLSLCAELLDKHPWLRLTGGWVLPQHLHLYDGTYDDLKLAGRVTLRFPEKYIRVLDAYVKRKPLAANDIGGGPASVQDSIEVTEDFFQRTLVCRHNCEQCTFCRDYYAAASLLRESTNRGQPSNM